MEVKKRGGKRTNSGRKPLDYKIKVVGFKVHIDIADGLKKVAKSFILDEMKKIKKTV